MNLSNNDDNICDIKENHILSFKNNNNNKAFLLNKMINSNKKNKNKFNISNKKYILKKKLPHNTNIKPNLNFINIQNSFNSNKNNAFENDILIKLNNKNEDLYNLKEIFRNENIIIKKTGNNNEIKLNTINNFSRTEKLFKNNRINSANYIITIYNKEFKNIGNLFNLNKINNKYDDIQKILAFKENIFVHEKNILFLDKDKNNIINKINYNTYTYEDLSNNSKTKINRKLNRTKSAVYGIKLKNNNNDNFQNKQKKLFDDKYYDLSYVINNYNNSIIKTSNNNFKRNNKNKFKSDTNQKIIKTSKLEKLSSSPILKKNPTYNTFKYNYININNYESKNSNNNILLTKNILKKQKKIHLTRMRPVPMINEKYLIYLPKDLKKDIKNKYNFFSYLLTENINFNTISKNNKSKSHKFMGFRRNRSLYSIKNNYNNKINSKLINKDKIKNNIEQHNTQKEYKLNCRKEAEFMNYLKKLDYDTKLQERILHTNSDDINNKYKEKIIQTFKKRNNKKKIKYKPVKIKSEISSNYEIFKRNDSELYDKIFGICDESVICEKIKSQPFINKKKKSLK